MTGKLLPCCILTLAFLQACSPQSSDTTVGLQQSMVLVDAVMNMAYSGIHDDEVTLTDGRWEGEPFSPAGASRPTVGIIQDFMLEGDLDGDGTDELVVFLWESSGGSGTYVHVAVAGARDGKNLNIATARVGDRVQLRSGHINNETIHLEVVQQGPGDSACCPSQLAHRQWRLDADGLTELQAEITGVLSISELSGQEWELFKLDLSMPLQAGPRVTLVVNGGHISGNSSCNRYFASVSDGDTPGDLSVSRLGSTRMDCSPADMEVEKSYLSALGGAVKFGFFYGKLAFSWLHEGNVQTMLFSPATE